MSPRHCLLMAAFAAFLLLLFATPLWAPNCHKGKPCGNACIPLSSECHIGESSPTYSGPPSSSSTPQMPTPSRSLYSRPLGTQVTPYRPPTVICTGDPSSPWVASFADGVYFAAGCTTALDLAPANRRYFPSERAAVEAGYRRSRTPNC